MPDTLKEYGFMHLHEEQQTSPRRAAALLRRDRQHCGERHNACMSTEAYVLNINFHVLMLLNLPGMLIST